MSINSLESSPSQESVEESKEISEADIENGKNRLNEIRKNAEQSGNLGHWAKLAAEMRIVNPETEFPDLEDKDFRKKVEDSLDAKKTEAQKTGDWLVFASEAANLKIIDPENEVGEKEQDEILKQLQKLEVECRERGKWYDYVALLSKFSIINPEKSPVPSETDKKSIIEEAKKINSASNLTYAARVRTIFPDLNADDLGCDPGVMNEVDNNLETQKNYYHNYDNFFELSANKRIVSAKKIVTH